MTYEEYIKKDYEIDNDEQPYYIIDFIPCTPYQDDFLLYESYMEDNHEMDFAKKIASISLKLIYSYCCEVYFCSDYGERLRLDKYDVPEDVNIRNIGPEKLERLIKNVITKWSSSVSIFFKDENFSMVISRHFSVVLYDMPRKFEPIMKLLAEQEGLFLKYRVSGNGEFILI